jgi:hypothetical protein
VVLGRAVHVYRFLNLGSRMFCQERVDLDR